MTKKMPVTVVRLIICDTEGRVLLHQRKNTDFSSGGWCLPGGKIDYDETIEQSVVNELKEETNLDCTTSKFLFYQDSLPPTPGSMHCVTDVSHGC